LCERDEAGLEAVFRGFRAVDEEVVEGLLADLVAKMIEFAITRQRAASALSHRSPSAYR